MKCAQLVHAAGESAAASKYAGDFPYGTYAIALQAKDRHHLAEISCLLLQAKIPHKRIFESDAPYDGELMAIGIYPMERDVIRKLLSNLPLVK